MDDLFWNPTTDIILLALYPGTELYPMATEAFTGLTPCCLSELLYLLPFLCLTVSVCVCVCVCVYLSVYECVCVFVHTYACVFVL